MRAGLLIGPSLVLMTGAELMAPPSTSLDQEGANEVYH